MAKPTKKEKEAKVEKEGAKNLLALLDASRGGYFGVAPGQPDRVWYRRLNGRALLIVLGVVALLAALYYPLRLIQGAGLRRSALAQARALADEGQVDAALVHLDAYLDEWPDDLPGLSLVGELIADHDAPPERVLAGALAIEQVLRFDSDSTDRQDDRTRLVKLYLRIGDLIRAAIDRNIFPMETAEGRYRAAGKLAEQRVKLGADDAEAHRLLGLCLERLSLSGGGDAEAEANAIKAYQKALRRDPGDVAASERLAGMRLAKKDRAGADQILEDLIRARPKLVEARIARARHFLATGRDDRAKVEAEMASQLAPLDTGVRLLAAGMALRREDPAAARRHLEAVPKDSLAGPRASILLGQIALAERKPDDAVKQWRQALARVSGTDSELTWRLAQLLIRLGRITEARPLIAQFRRLAGKEDDPMLRMLHGLVKEKTGRPSAARAELEPVRDEVASEWKPELEMTLGRCFEAAGDLDRARTAYGKARDQAPLASAPRRSLARLLRDTDPAKAADELESGARGARPDASLFAELARVRAVQQLAIRPEDRNWSAAEAALARGRRVKADDPDLALATAEVLAASGRVDPSIAGLELATSGSGRTSKELWLALADLLIARGRLADAASALERGEAPGQAEEPAPLRVARARLLLRGGRGREAVALLSKAPANIELAGRAELARARVEVLRELGDRAGARLACREWAELAPEQPGPGLFLIDLGQQSGDPETLELGLDLLRKVGGDDEPYSLAAQALAILLPNRQGEADASQLDQAEVLSQRLQEVAPSLPVSSLVHGLLMERSRGFEEAIADYKLALKGDASGTALARLVALLARLERFPEIEALKKSPSESVAVDRLSLASAVASGDKGRADAVLQQLVEAEPDSVPFRSAKAAMLRELGKPAEAEATLRDLVDRHPERPQPWLALVASQASTGDKAAVASTIARASAGYKGERPWLLTARLHWISGDRAAASKAYADALAAHPDDLPTLRAASELFEAEGTLDRAEALLRKAMTLDSRASWAPRRLALVLSARGADPAWSEAWTLVKAGGPGSGASPEDRLILATVLERSPDPARQAESIAALAALADDLNPEHPTARAARVRLAQIRLASGDFAGAASAIEPATESADETDPANLALAVEALTRSNRTEAARLRLDRLVAVEPDSPRAVACRALVLKAEGDESGASSTIEDAAAAAEALPDGESRHVFYLDQLARLALDEPTTRVARRMAELWPRRAWALASLLAAKGMVAEALEACRISTDAGASREPLQVVVGLDLNGKLDPEQSDKARALTLAIAAKAPADPAVLALTASLLHHQKRPEEEVALYRRALEADPSNAYARNNLAWALSEDLNRPAEGLTEVDQAIARSGFAPRLGDTRGVILTRLGRGEEAVAELTRVVAAEPGGSRYLHFARALARIGRVEERNKALRDAQKAGLPVEAFDPDERAIVEKP
jgi:tetratricopeptide (TPR) repeat protein